MRLSPIYGMLRAGGRHQATSFWSCDRRKTRTRSTVAKVILAPTRRRETNFPSLTASFPNVVSATLWVRRYSSISASRIAWVSIAKAVVGYIPFVKAKVGRIPFGR